MTHRVGPRRGKNTPGLRRVIDVHTHCSERRDDRLVPYALRNGLRYDLEELLSLMARNDVERALLLSPPVGDSGEPLPNGDIMALCARGGDKLFPVLTVEPDDASVREAVSTAKERAGYVKAFKVRLGYRRVFADSRVFEPLYDAAVELGLPVLFHTGDTATPDGSLEHAHPLTLDRVANARRELTIVICHFGNPWIADTAELIYKHENVFTDISGLIAGGAKYSQQYADYLAARISEAAYFAGGTNKILFGTDYPVQTHDNTLALVSRLKVERDDLEAILWRNAQELFFS